MVANEDLILNKKNFQIARYTMVPTLKIKYLNLKKVLTVGICSFICFERF